ncbi:hypothetical protein NE237_021605 [Protea cynaroides]|uniref:Uncharacterized protein n=1 Tax=Protea cynaroides TaxID=273540 RepID=A0A9Q0H9F3_9MAGN|nr:hypothetical protein NE237_021605 [Protea cynaroides]
MGKGQSGVGLGCSRGVRCSRVLQQVEGDGCGGEMSMAGWWGRRGRDDRQVTGGEDEVEGGWCWLGSKRDAGGNGGSCSSRVSRGWEGTDDVLQVSGRRCAGGGEMVREVVAKIIEIWAYR